MLILRAAIVAVSAAAVVFGVTRLHDVRACSAAKDRGFAAALGKPIPGGPERLARDITDHCRGGADLSATSVALARRGALAPAAQLAHEAIRRDPRDYQGWVALAIVLQREGHPLAQRAAARRAVALNPRYAAARQLASAPAPAGGGGP